MDDSVKRQLEQALEEFGQQRDALVKARDELAALSVTMRSKDRSVEVTVGPQGEPTALRFLNNKYKAMSAQALAASVLEVLTAARQDVAQTSADRLAEFTGEGLSVAGSNLEGIDFDRLLEPLSGDGMLSWLYPKPADVSEAPSSTPGEGRSHG
ncbi:YbaB/EbfC family nucleoid-associated protein [Streptomyces sp. NPDC002755]